MIYRNGNVVGVKGGSNGEGSRVWVVMTGELRELVLYWTQSLTYTLNSM